MNPDLVVRDDKGELYSVRYDAVNAMLLNEFLKEHRTVQELKTLPYRLSTFTTPLAAPLSQRKYDKRVIEIHVFPMDDLLLTRKINLRY